MTIWKYQFKITDEFDIGMPNGSRVLHVAIQNDTPCMWVLCDPSARRIMRRFYVFGTGHPVHEKAGAHVGSLLMHGGALVFHVFEEVAL